MKKIKSFLVAAMAMAFVALMFTACGDDDKSDTIDNIVSEYTINDQMVANQKAKSGKNVAVLLVAFGSTWNNAFQAFDKTKAAYEAAFPNADVYMSFSSDICINRASAGENTDDNGNIVRRDYYEPRYLLHAIGAAKYGTIYVQSLQVIPGEEFAAVVAAVKKFMNNGYIASAHLDDDYLARLEASESIFLGMPLLSDPDKSCLRWPRNSAHSIRPRLKTVLSPSWATATPTPTTPSRPTSVTPSSRRLCRLTAPNFSSVPSTCPTTTSRT